MLCWGIEYDIVVGCRNDYKSKSKSWHDSTPDAFMNRQPNVNEDLDTVAEFTTPLRRGGSCTRPMVVDKRLNTLDFNIF